MERTDFMNIFLIKLAKQRKLELVEKSDELKHTYLIKSENCLRSAKILFKELIHENALIDTYYAMYDCVLALFFKCGIKSENHTGSITLLKELFELPKLAKMLEEAKKSRIDSQYYVDIQEKPTSDLVKKAISDSESFILELKTFMSNIKVSEEDNIRDKLSRGLK